MEKQPIGGAKQGGESMKRWRVWTITFVTFLDDVET
jgi:hypothetical protein